MKNNEKIEKRREARINGEKGEKGEGDGREKSWPLYSINAVATF